MFSQKTKPMACSGVNCREVFTTDDVLFECLNPICDNHEAPDEWADHKLFKPDRFKERANCTYCGQPSYVMRCPNCFEMLPAGMGSDSTVAVVGARTSGKTCYITALIRQINQELAKEEAFGMSLEWLDQRGLEYFREKEDDIFRHHRLPEFTPHGTPVSMQITIRFPVFGLRRLRGSDGQGTVSLIFPDPAGDQIETMQEAYFLTYLANARAIVLMVDPLAEAGYREILRSRGRPEPTYLTESAYVALMNVVRAVRNQLGKQKGKLDKQLAVVVTKCDEFGVFDPDEHSEEFPLQGHKYDRRLTRDLSARVRDFVERDLKLPNLVALARESFKDVHYFSASALGFTPHNGQIVKPVPRRVEEPLLWILSQWGLI